MAQPKAFYSYMENEDKLNMLSDEQAGRLYKSLYAYARTGEKPDLSDDPLVAYAFADFVIDVDRDFENYADMCAKRSEAGKKSGESRRKKSGDEQTRTKRTSVNFVQQNTNKNEQTRTNANKTNETEAETEAEAEDNVAIAPLSNGARLDFDDRANEIVGLFNEICTDLPKVTKLTDHRRRLIYQAERDGVDYCALFEAVQRSEFLTKKGGFGFDWVMRPDNRQKIIEGNYRNRDKPPDKKRGSMFSADGASFDLEKYAKRSVFDD